ncbi:MAG: hypothetical protein U9N10_02965 [Bacillota bacterium]|nr:hypothetical protein [Bacillota bacterium]
MEYIFSIFIGLLIVLFTIKQIKKIVSGLKDGTCATCSSRSTCKLNLNNCDIVLDMKDKKIPNLRV